MNTNYAKILKNTAFGFSDFILISSYFYANVVIVVTVFSFNTLKYIVNMLFDQLKGPKNQKV